MGSLVMLPLGCWEVDGSSMSIGWSRGAAAALADFFERLGGILREVYDSRSWVSNKVADVLGLTMIVLPTFAPFYKPKFSSDSCRRPCRR